MKRRPVVSVLKRIPHYCYAKLRIKELSAAGQIPGAGVVHVRLPARYTHVPLFHKRTHEWLMILKGSGRGVIGGRVVRFRPGVIVYIPPGMLHQMGTGSVPVEALAIFSPPLDARKRGADICYPAG